MPRQLFLYRLRTEWSCILLCLFFASVFLIWSGWVNPPPSGRYQFFVQQYSSYKPETAANALDMDVSELEDMQKAYQLFMQRNRGVFYTNIISGTEIYAGWPITYALAIMLLSNLFTKRRVSRWLSSGCSRVRAFFSMTLVFYLSVLFVWLCSSHILLTLFQIRFSSEEKNIFIIIQIAWFFAFLFRSSIAYMSVFLLRRPLPVALVTLGTCIGLRVLKAHISFIPLRVIPLETPGGPNEWFSAFCDNLQPVITGNIIVIVFFCLALTISWLVFRRMGVE